MTQSFRSGLSPLICRVVASLRELSSSDLPALRRRRASLGVGGVAGSFDETGREFDGDQTFRALVLPTAWTHG